MTTIMVRKLLLRMTPTRVCVAARMVSVRGDELISAFSPKYSP